MDTPAPKAQKTFEHNAATDNGLAIRDFAALNLAKPSLRVTAFTSMLSPSSAGKRDSIGWSPIIWMNSSVAGSRVETT